jgi:hypothetical protein
MGQKTAFMMMKAGRKASFFTLFPIIGHFHYKKKGRPFLAFLNNSGLLILTYQ